MLLHTKLRMLVILTAELEYINIQAQEEKAEILTEVEQRKKEKEVQKMRSNIEVGDEIVTIGGIMGIVTSIKEDVLVIETGADRSKVRIAKWAVQENLTVHDAPAE